MLAPAHLRDRPVQRRSVPEDRQSLRKLHGQLILAELTEDAEGAKRLLARAPSQYRAVHALVSFLPRVLRECEAERCAERVRVGDAPSDELDAIEAEPEDEIEPDTKRDEPEVEPIATIRTADNDQSPDAEQPRGVADVTEQEQEPASMPVASAAAEPPLAWRSIQSVRNAMLSAARAEKRAAAKSAAASNRLKKLDAQAGAAEAAARSAAEEATAAARAVSDVLGAGGQGGRAAARAAERYGALADAQGLLAASRRKAAAAQARAARAHEAAMRKVHKTYLLIARAGVAYDDFVSKAILTRANHDSPRGVAAKPAANEAQDDDEGPGVTSYLGAVASPKAADVEAEDGDPVARFLADPTVHRVSRLGEGDLLAIATDWTLRDRVQTWYVCDRQSPIPPWVRSRELVMLEIRWRVRHAELPADFERRAAAFVPNQGVVRRQRGWGSTRGRQMAGSEADGGECDSTAPLMAVEQCGREPLSLRDLVDELGGNQASGHQRASMEKEVAAAVASFYEMANQIEDTDERAAILLLHMVARDGGFEAENWMKELFAAHREALDETFHRPDHGRALELGGDSEGDGDKATGSTAKGSSDASGVSDETVTKIAPHDAAGRVPEAARLACSTPWQFNQRQLASGRFRTSYQQTARLHSVQQASQ